MVVGAVVCLCLAALIAGSGLWTLRRGSPADLTGQVLRLVVPTQLAAALTLAAAGVVALAVPGRVGAVGLAIGVLGALGTVATGSWQGARYAARRESVTACQADGGCGNCEKACR